MRGGLFFSFGVLILGTAVGLVARGGQCFFPGELILRKGIGPVPPGEHRLHVYPPRECVLGLILLVFIGYTIRRFEGEHGHLCPGRGGRLAGDFYPSALLFLSSSSPSSFWGNSATTGFPTSGDQGDDQRPECLLLQHWRQRKGKLCKWMAWWSCHRLLRLRKMTLRSTLLLITILNTLNRPRRRSAKG